jgi:hypothetical protein
MALISFGYRVDMYAIAPPTDPAGYIIAYDLDGILKQKNHLGIVSLVGSGTSGTSGSSGTSGVDGIAGGQLFYFNESVTGFTASYKHLGNSPVISSEEIVTKTLGPTESNVLMSSYMSDSLGLTVIPGGVQRFSLHYKKGASESNISTYVVVQLANQNGDKYYDLGATQAIAYSNTQEIGWENNNTTNISLDIISITSEIQATDRIVISLYTNNLDTTTQSVSFYTEGSNNYSYVQTSTAVVPGAKGATGHGVTSSFYLQGTNDYSYDTTSDIYRTGSLAIGTSGSSTSKLHVYATQSGAFQLQDGTEETDYILTSNNSGVASWTSSNFITNPISLTYSGLQNLVTTNALQLGRRYILTDYLHKYQVLGSDSGAITQYHTMIGSLYDEYCQFNNVPSQVAIGSIVTVVSVPIGATITVGTTYSVSLWFNTAYIKFSPTTSARVANIGTVFSFQKQRYPNVPTDSIILDNNSKVVMKKGGVINIDVHDGTDYMSMSASQNTEVQTEQLVLTAISDSQFSVTAESLTYTGDTVEYLFDNSDILDEDGNSLGVQRSGFIIGRSNNNLDISMDKDWRNQRYRRYKIDSKNWADLTLSGSSSTLYTLGGYNYGGVVNESLDDGHKYLLRYPYEIDMYLDFYCDSIPVGTYSYTNTDTFKNGEGFGLPDPNWITPVIGASYRLGNDIVNIYSRSITANGATYSDLKYAFDYPIIPMNVYEPKSLVSKARIKSLTNTVFKDLNQNSGSSNNFDLDINTIENSTINTGNVMFSTEGISAIRILDNFNISNHGEITNLFISYRGNLTNYGQLHNCRISGNKSVGSVGLRLKINNSTVYNSIFGFGRADSFWINNSIINRSMFLVRSAQIFSLSGHIYHTSLNAPVDIYSTLFNFNNFNVQKQISSTQSKGFYGVKHTISSNINNIQIDNYNPKLELLSKSMDINYDSFSYSIIGITE